MNRKDNQQSETKTVVLLPESVLQYVTDTLSELKDLVKKNAESELNDQWVDSMEARKMLHVSQKTWQTYRDRKIIPYSQFGRKIYVRKADLYAFIESHLIAN